MDAQLHANAEIEFHKSVVPAGHVCKSATGFDFSQIRYVREGECRIGGGKSPVTAGEMLYIPANAPYELVWGGDEGACFYTLEFRTDAPLTPAAQPVSFVVKEGADLFFRLEDSVGKRNTFLSLSVFWEILAKAEAAVSKERGIKNPVAPAVAYVGAHLCEDFKVSDLAKLCCLSESRFYTLFKETTGESPIDYKNSLRISKAHFLLKEGFSVEEVSEALGFCSAAFFRRVFKKHTGKNPGKVK